MTDTRTALKPDSTVVERFARIAFRRMVREGMSQIAAENMLLAALRAAEVSSFDGSTSAEVARQRVANNEEPDSAWKAGAR